MLTPEDAFKHYAPTSRYPVVFFSLHVLRLKYLQVFCSMSISFSACFSHVHLVVLTVFGVFHKSWSSSLCSVSPFLVNSSLLGPNALLSTLFLNTLKGWLYHKGEIKFHRYKNTTGKMYNVIFCWPCSSLWFLVTDQLDAQFFSIYLFQFSACVEQHCAHHQENQLYQYNLW